MNTCITESLCYVPETQEINHTAIKFKRRKKENSSYQIWLLIGISSEGVQKKIKILGFFPQRF